jgi:hypothetical protein
MVIQSLQSGSERRLRSGVAPCLIRSPENHMSYSVHIVRQKPEGQEAPITQDEWNAFIDEDPELKRPEQDASNYREGLVLLPSNDVSPDEWQSLRWVTGSILSDYPQQPMLKKMGQIARHFAAVVMSDDGDIWTLDEEGRVSIEGY